MLMMFRPSLTGRKLDGLSVTEPVYASLVHGDKSEHKPIWSR